jgi:transcriptional regulator with XRE-family HTH domain
MGWPNSETAARLAAASGASRATVSRWLRDGQIRIDAQYGFRLADATGFSARWILLGEGEAQPTTLDLSPLPADLRPEVVRLIHVLAAIVGRSRQAETR